MLILQLFATCSALIIPFCHCLTNKSKSSGAHFTGLPNFTPFIIATLIPCSCLFLMFSLSFCATNESTCNTKSAIKVPNKSFAVLQSPSAWLIFAIVLEFLYSFYPAYLSIKYTIYHSFLIL